MRAVDTNVLVRLLVRDDLDQVRTAESFIAPGAWVSHLVLAESLWVLDAVYERTTEQISAAIERLLNHKELAKQDTEVVTAALTHFKKRPALGLTCCCATAASGATTSFPNWARSAAGLRAI
jgi:predicted nucleic-acid-binding protein